MGLLEEKGLADWFGLIPTILWLKDLSLSLSLSPMSQCVSLSKHAAKHRGVRAVRGLWQYLFSIKLVLFKG